MSLLADLESFVREHQPHGALTGDATEPTMNGYMLTVTCPCGIVFQRWVTPEEATVDLAWLRPMVTVALHTGMRLGELRNLRWEDVDDKTASIRIRRDKAGDGRWVTMNSAVQTALLTIKRQRKVLGSHVFCSPEGKYLHNFERYWRPAVRAASLPDFRFHDLRHTFASRLAMKGVDMYTVQRAGGWKTASMVQRYAHLSPDHMRAAVEKLVVGAAEGRNRH